jgi:hypothetical protein
VRAALIRLFLRIPFLRRFYVRRVLAFLEKTGKRRKPLPTELQQLQAALARLPTRARKLEVLEAALRGSATGDAAPSRALRRAAAKQTQARPGTKGRRKRR